MKVFIISLLCFQFLYVSDAAKMQNCNGNHNPYPELNQPFVEPLCPQGFRVSVPNIKGMQSFGFHANVNSPIRLNREATYSDNVRQASANGRWEYSTSDLKLRNADVIHYWITVQINHDNYCIKNLKYIVEDYEPCAPSNEQRLPSISPAVEAAAISLSAATIAPITLPATICNNNNNQNQDLALIVNQLNTTLMQLNSLNAIVNPLRQQVESLTELLQEVIKDSDIGTKLLLKGQIVRSNPVETVRDVLTEKLQLYDLDTKIHQAEYTSEGILFEMSSSIDKRRILFRASKFLQNGKYSIVDPESYKYNNEEKLGRSSR